MTARVLLYGHRGYTGSLIHGELREEIEVTACARCGPGANDGGLALEDRDSLRAVVGAHDVVLNCAGPFARTWRPLAEACLETGAHYLDLCAEWRVFEALRGLDDVACERGVMLLPGIGFDVVARLSGAERLQIGVAGLDLASRGSARTMLDLAGEPLRVRRAGRLVTGVGRTVRPGPAGRRGMEDAMTP